MKRRPSYAQEQALLAALVYAAIFDYPLTEQQLHETLIGVAADPKDVARWYAASDRLQAAIETCDGYFFPRGRRDLIGVRHAREIASRSVMRDLARPLKLIARMPFVRMVALSGSLAHLNASRGADLDLFVITKSNRAWSVVVTLIAVARLVGWRRQLCVNYVVTERQLTVEPQDLFTANQIIHLRPLVGDSVYRKFLAANAFVPDFYPNFAPRACAWRDEDRYLSRWLERILDWTVAPIYERCCRAIYGWHLRRRAASWLSRDQVRLEPDCLKLHTSSHRQSVMERFAIGMAEAERVTPAAAVRARAAR